MNLLEERAYLAEKDSKQMDDLAEELRNLHWIIDACGQNGKPEYERVKEKARRAIKTLSNYL